MKPVFSSCYVHTSYFSCTEGRPLIVLYSYSTGETSGTTATVVIVDGWTVTVASVGDSRCILDTQGGALSTLTVDHRLEENVEEYVLTICRIRFLYPGFCNG